MVTITRYSPAFLFSMLVMLLSACGEDDNPMGVHFDRSALLLHYADDLILPAYGDLTESVGILQDQVIALTESPTPAELEQARDRWTTAFLNWQSANAYNFGPAGEAGDQMDLLQEVGTFPVDANLIENHISVGLTDLRDTERDARGFLALEYLLFGQNESIDAVFAKLMEDENRRNYLLAVSTDLNNRLITINNDWVAFKTSFLVNAGTDAGSSISQLYNEFVRSFEAAKNFKVGLPAGKSPGQLTTAPQLVEAFYSGQSLPMLKAHLANIKQIYTGGNGLGFKDYLLAVEGGPDLVSLTEEQWDEVMVALDNVPTDRSFADLIAEEHPSIDVLHTELQRHTRFFKSDMSSLLGIAITFASGDGD